MLKRIIRNNLRNPAYSLVVLAFAAVLTVVLCWLYRSGVEEQRSFDQTYAAVPVIFRVTDLDGSKTRHIDGWIAEQFGDRGIYPTLEAYVKTLHTRVSCLVTLKNTVLTEDGKFQTTRKEYEVAGIQSLYVAQELTADWGGKVYWYEGFEEAMLSTEAEICLVPESMKDKKTMEMPFVYSYVRDHQVITNQTERSLTVAGYYVDPGNERIYCPYPLMERVHAELAKPKEIQELCAVLNDNNNLALLKEDVAMWFAEPNPAGEKTEWGRFSYDYYLYAMDIDDYMLRVLENDLKSSMQLNNLASFAVFFLSAGAGFLTGFLVIRSKKREIALMRTMGDSHLSIFVQLALEQMLCLLAGIALGGSVFLWQPLDRLGLFAGIYFGGLSVALLIFLWKNLLTTIKEDE